ncbi:hypothetical protein KY023_004424, partial [Vibrio vulnificus]|nr:hypothetical protein [Vibrio vulnificus]
VIRVKKISSYLGELNEVSAKHRSNILVLSVIVFLVDPNVVISFGNASLAGLGITIVPKQDINIGYILLGLLVYRFIAFWFSILSTSGRNFSAAESRALSELQPDYLTEQPGTGNLDQEVARYARKSVRRWKNYSFVWDIYLPSALAVIATIFFICKLNALS